LKASFAPSSLFLQQQAPLPAAVYLLLSSKAPLSESKYAKMSLFLILLHFIRQNVSFYQFFKLLTVIIEF
jgi:hypothetical protein